MAFTAICPLPSDRADINAAIVASTIANANRGKDTPAFKITDFLIDYEARFKEQQSKEETAEEIKSAFAAFRAMHSKA